MVHHLAVGAVISAAVLVVVFLSFDGINNESELVIQPTTCNSTSRACQSNNGDILGNGSPMLGDSNAPITLVEFGDYQCHL